MTKKRLLKDWIVALLAVGSGLVLIVLGIGIIFVNNSRTWHDSIIGTLLLLLGLAFQPLTWIIIRSLRKTGRPLEPV